MGEHTHSAPDDSPRLQDASIGVLVADCHAVVREGLKALVNARSDMRVVGATGDGAEAVSLAEETNPDVVVVEVSLPGLDGARLTARLREARPDRKVLVLTACEEQGELRRLLEAGAAGYVLKRAAVAELIQAIRAVAGGGTYLDPALAGSVVDNSARPVIDRELPAVELSEREAGVVRLIALGYANKEIAARLKVSVKTVETYKTRSMEKLHIRSRVDIVRHAIKSGWLTDTSSDQPAPLLASHDEFLRTSS